VPKLKGILLLQHACCLRQEEPLGLTSNMVISYLFLTYVFLSVLRLCAQRCVQEKLFFLIGLETEIG
jgi:hypothetical protein